MNTLFEYLYRDASNYKEWGSIVFAGEASDGLRQRLIRALDSGEFFIADQVRVPEVFPDTWPMDSDDLLAPVGSVGADELNANRSVWPLDGAFRLRSRNGGSCWMAELRSAGTPPRYPRRMTARSIETRWMELPIVCPHCGNHGHSKDRWTMNAAVPFKLIEDVVRLFEFSAAVDKSGTLDILGDVNTDRVDWESGSNLRIACMACFSEFAIPENASVDFD